MPQLKIWLYPDEYVTVSVDPGANLLGGALDQEVQLKYSCRAGSCLACRVKVLSGAEHLTEPTAAEKEILAEKLEEGFRLSCQAAVYGDVEIAQHRKRRPVSTAGG